MLNIEFIGDCSIDSIRDKNKFRGVSFSDLKSECKIVYLRS